MPAPGIAAGGRRPSARIVAVVAGVLVAAACTAPASPPSTGPAASPTAPLVPGELRRFERVVCDLPPPSVQRIWRGYHPERSGEIQIVPEEPHFVGAWLSHSGPWEYVQRVPMFLYGPGQVPRAGRVAARATMADLAPTLARYLRFDFDAPDGAPIDAAAPIADRPPRLILTVVWDSVGINVLEEHADAWPTLRRLTPDGVWVDHAFVGSSPSVTQAVHATVGTGAFPRRHGLVDLRIRAGGTVQEPLLRGPGFLELPTLADLYDRAHGNDPLVGIIAPHGTLGMIGHGAFREGGDRHVAINTIRGVVQPMVGDLARYYRFPEYVEKVGGLEEAARELDLEDGVLDGRWLGESVLEAPEDLLTTPAFNDYQTAIMEELIRREGFGAHELTDMLFVNYRAADAVGHRWSMNSPQMEAAVRSLDEMLGRTIRYLDRRVGEGEWALALIADHGSTPHPEVSGATVIDARRLAAAIEDRFGEGVVEQARVTQIWMRMDRLQENGAGLADVADLVAGFTKGDNAADPEELPEGERDDRLFAGAFPSSALETAPCVPEG